MHTMKKLDERITSIEQIDDEFAGKTIDEILDELLGPEESEDDFEDDLQDDAEDEFDFDTLSPDDSETSDDEFLELEDEDALFDFDSEQEENFDDVNLDDFSDAFPEDLDSQNDEDDTVNDAEFDPESIDSQDELQTGETDNVEQEENPNFQGILRTVMGANLVYKRQTEDGKFEELWIYNVGDDVKQEIKIRKAILAGTDILPGSVTSQDGTQELDTYTVGNVQYLRITGLPN